MAKTAIVFGGTGLTGRYLVTQLLADLRYDKVKVISRRSLGLDDPKLEEYITDLLNKEIWTDLVTGDDVFCCIGTTKKKTPDKDHYYKIDFGIPKNAASAGKNNGVQKFAVVSAIGANSKSSIFYNKLKGEMEEAVKSMGPSAVYIMRPSIIDGPRGESRLLEKIGLGIFKLLGFMFVGSFRKYRLIHARDIAKAMIEAVNSESTGGTFESDEVQELANNAKSNN
ncbi:MAG: NAD(P)H-binding protein [Crocinitomicaceae bacterium]